MKNLIMLLQKFIEKFKNVIIQIKNFFKFFLELLQKKIFIATLINYILNLRKKLQNLTPEEKLELISEIRFRIIYHVGTFLIAYQLISIFVDYFDQNF